MADDARAAQAFAFGRSARSEATLGSGTGGDAFCTFEPV